MNADATLNGMIVFSEGKNTFNYFVESKIGEGGEGIVYRVKDESEQVYALKVCKDKSAPAFLANSQEAYKKSLPHFVRVVRVGSITHEQEQRSAIIMDWGGSDLQEVYKGLLALSNSPLAEAFRYKVALTVLDGLVATEAQGAVHGDLIPRNILCGVDISDFSVSDDGKSQRGLEQRVAESEIKLCDRKRNLDPVAISWSLSYSTQRDPQRPINDIYFIDPVGEGSTTDGRPGKEKDLYAALAIVAWARNGHTRQNVVQFAAELGLNVSYDADKQRMVYDFSFADLKSKVSHLISDKSYFIVDTLQTKGRDSYPVVLRPIDAFHKEWVGQRSSGKDLTGRSQIEAMHKTHAFSYEKLQELGGAAMPAAEREGLRLLLEDVLMGSMVSIYRLFDKNTKARKPLEDENSELDKGIASHEKKLTNLRTAYEKAEESRKGIVTQLSRASDKDLEDKLVERGKEVRRILEEEVNLKREVDTLEDKVKINKGKIKVYDNAPLEEAIGYIKSNFLSGPGEGEDKGLLPPLWIQRFLAGVTDDVKQGVATLFGLGNMIKDGGAKRAET